MSPRRRALNYLFIVVLLVALALDEVELLHESITMILSGAAILGIAVASGDTWIKFVVPLAAALVSFGLAYDVRAFGAFYSTCAQVIPVLVLAALIEQRDLLRDEARNAAAVVAFGLTLFYMLLGEAVALVGTARCGSDGICSLEGSAGLVVGGLAGGVASLVVVGLLPRAKPTELSDEESRRVEARLNALKMGLAGD